MALVTRLALSVIALLLVGPPAQAGQSLQNAPAVDGAVGDQAQLAFAVVAMSLAGLVLFGVRLVTSRRARRP